MKEILHRMDEQDRNLKEIKEALVGKEFPRVEGMVSKLDKVQSDVHILMEERSQSNYLKEIMMMRKKQYREALLVACKILGAFGAIGGFAYAVLVWVVSHVLTN